MVFQSTNKHGITWMVKNAAWKTLHEMHLSHGLDLATSTIRKITKSAERIKMSLNIHWELLSEDYLHRHYIMVTSYNANSVGVIFLPRKVSLFLLHYIGYVHVCNPQSSVLQTEKYFYLCGYVRDLCCTE